MGAEMQKHQRPKNYTVISIPTHLFWTLIIIYGTSLTIQTAAEIVRWAQPETDATLECRKVDKSTIGLEISAGTMCVRPVHFIERGRQ